MVDHSDYTRVSIFFNFIKLLHYLNVAILKTNVLAGNDHVIDIFTSEGYGKYLTVYFSLCHCLLYNKWDFFSNLKFSLSVLFSKLNLPESFPDSLEICQRKIVFRTYSRK